MLLQIISYLVEMIVRILGIKTEENLGLQTYIKVMLRVVTTMFTKLPITMNLAIRTAYSIVIHISLNGHQNLLE